MNKLELIEKLNKVREIWPELASRYERGIAIYEADQVSANDDGKSWVVTTGPGPRHRHYVYADTYSLSCACPDYFHGAPRRNGRTYCKHIIAVELYRKNGPFPSPARPFLVHGGSATIIRMSETLPEDRYGNGEAIEPDLILHAQTYRELYRQQPADREKLLGWVWR